MSGGSGSLAISSLMSSIIHSIIVMNIFLLAGAVASPANGLSLREAPLRLHFVSVASEFILQLVARQLLPQCYYVLYLHDKAVNYAVNTTVKLRR